MADFGLVRSFGIDNGELDGLRPKDCFVLGYELACVDMELKTGEAIRRPVHAENKDRIESELTKQGREWTLTWMEGDSSEAWMDLNVAPTVRTARG